MSIRRLATLALVALALTGCASTPGIPETTYFRLPPRADIAAFEKPLFEHPISVETLIADGLYSDQALIYSLDPAASRLRAYHYQLWVDPPTRMLQRRIIGALRDVNAASIVADRLPSQQAQVRISGRIERLERVRRETGWVSAVRLSLRVEAPDDGIPVLLKEYDAEVPAAGTSVRDSVTAMGSALDQVLAAFIRDLRDAKSGG